MQKKCEYFSSPKGCYKGNNCKFLHIRENSERPNKIKINQSSKKGYQNNGSFLSKKFLTDLISKSSNDIINDLSLFPDLIQSINNTDLKEDFFFLMIELLALISPVNSDPCKMIMNSFIKSNFFDKLGKFYKDTKFMINIIQNCKNDTMASIDKFFLECIKVFEEYTYKFYSDLAILPVVELTLLIDKLFKYPQSVKYFTQILGKANELNETLEKAQFKFIEKELERKDKPRVEEYNIPISYKEQSLYLTKEEIYAVSKPMIQRHRAKGDYESWDRYLNTMFFLVREDCYRSLRESIYNVSTQLEITRDIGKSERDIYYYKSVQIIDLIIDVKGIIFTVSFETFQTRMSWSKRLLFGSLLVLTLPDFNDMVMATVVEGPDPKKGPKNGKYYCKISLVNNEFSNFCKFIEWINQRHVLHMFESKAYYESYRHILKRIQDIDTRSLPFTDVIINYRKPQPQNVQYPYNAGILGRIGLSNPHHLIPSHFNNTTIMNLDNSAFYIYQDNWPANLTKCLDQSQLKALKHGIRNKVAIIQGPPGTGKTFVGSLITKLLLNNSDNPILIVCFTNHALDQFLRHISSFEKRIVRIGGRCKDEALQEFTLNNIRRSNFKTKDKRMGSVFRELKMKAEKLRNFCQNINQHTYLNYELCNLNFPVFVTRVIDNFFVHCRHLMKKDSKSVPFKSIYNAWVNPHKLNDLAKEIEFSKDKGYWVFLSKFEMLEKTEINVNAIVPNSNILANNNKFAEEVYEEDEEDLLENLDRREVEGIDNEDDVDYNEGDINVNEVQRELENLSIDDKDLDEYINGVSTKDIENLINSNQNLWSLNLKYRVAIISYVKRAYTKIHLESIKPDIEHFNHLIETKRELENMADLQYIKESKIVGMTTTGCAKFSTFLEHLNFETVIIEEAAEVLESHISSILTRNTKHLILIGDHQQLKPNPYNYEICKKYGFDVSLFERLINNEVPYVSLEYQRRMRPEFADFVRLIYTKTAYIDHDTTKNKPTVKGFTSNIFFLNHKQQEEVNAGIASKSNPFEAAFAAGLAKYAIQQNVDPSKITILTMYIAQVLLIRDELKKLGLGAHGIKIISVDNYQGEENDIIILSLVRSNKKNEIGFLKTFNRVCVAFSRAVLCFYVIANFECLVSGQDPRKEGSKFLWTEIYKLAQDKKIIDNKLVFKCQKHNIINIVQNPEDFKKLPEGGCGVVCKERLECGHVCEFFCHNFEHKNEHCNKPCARILTCGHMCKRKCKDICGKCFTVITKKLPCGHSAEAECHLDPNLIYCKGQVRNLLLCGHVGIFDCSLPSEKLICNEEIKVILPCGHQHFKKCKASIENERCKEKCNTALDCGHLCKGNCGDCLIGTLHVPCSEVCGKILICSHECKKHCSQPCLCDKKCENICDHGGRCKKGCLEECIPCNESCKVSCKHGKCSNLCNELCDFICYKRCEKKMKCGHICMGVCSEACPEVCIQCDPENEAFTIFFGEEDNADSLFFKLDCKHVFELSGLDKYMGIGSDDYSIQAKACPKCKKQIVRNNRYKNITKATFNLIQKIKTNLIRQYGNHSEIFDMIKETISQIKSKYSTDSHQNLAISSLFGYTLTLEKKNNIAELASAYNLCCLSKEMFFIETFNSTKLSETAVKNNFNKNVEKMKSYFKSKNCYSNKFFENLKLKIHSLYLFTQIADVDKYSRFANYLPMIESSKFMLTKNQIETLYKIVPKISEEEMMKIISVAGGVWYKCPNGHLYSVGECGRPMQESKCPECGNLIGGVDNNPHANNERFGDYRNNN